MALERFIPGTSVWWDGHGDHLARYLHALEFTRKGRVLDAGTGPGYGAALIQSAGARGVQAVDIDAETIEQARVTYRVDGLSFMVDDCEKLEMVSGPFDVICSFENIEHLVHPENF